MKRSLVAATALAVWCFHPLLHAQESTEASPDAGELADAGLIIEADAGLADSDAGAAEIYESAPPMEDLTQGKPAGEKAAEEAATTTASSAGQPAKGGGTNEVNGYLDTRTQFSRSRIAGLLSTRDVPELDELLELNIQLKHTYAGRGFVYADLSLFPHFAGVYRALGADGSEIVAPTHDVASTHPLVSINELYVSQDIGEKFNLLVGKKRVVWGPGFGFNPTDLINPPKDPTDPSFQRAGAWMVQLEENLGDYAFTVLGVPSATEQFNGIPSAFVRYPGWDPQDGAYHYLFAARAYALVASADLNLMLFYGNRFNDAFDHKLRVGASFSRYFFTDYEVHVEALFQQGSTRRYPNPDCGPDTIALFLCQRFQNPILDQSRLTDSTVSTKALAGTRRQFDDESTLSIEYYFQSDGFSRSEMQDYVNQLELLKGNRQVVAPITTTQATSGIPQKFTFDPLGRHYLIVNYSKPKIANDWTLGLSVIANLTDLSTFVTPSVSWSTTEWLTLTLSGFIPAPGPNSLASQTATGGYYGEWTLVPNLYRVLFEARIFY